MNLHPVEYKIIFNGKNITKDVSDYLLSLSYKDKHAGESDEVELQLHDKDLLWQNDWWPAKGSKISVQIIDGDSLLDCGTFTIDENEYTTTRSDADRFSIRGMAAVVTKALRTKNSSAHENKTLKELCNTIAAKHGLKLIGTIADIRISRITQYLETDLAFLHRISEKYGYTFSIRDGQMIFTSLKELVTKNHVLSVDKTECTTFSFKTSSKEVTRESVVSYHNPEKQTVVTKTVTRDETKINLGWSAMSQTDFIGVLNGDEDEEAIRDDAVINESVDNEQQAEALAETKQIKSIIQEETCQVQCPGNVLLVTGNKVELTGFGRFSGIWYIVDSEHSLDRSGGYVTSFSANKTGIVDSSKHHPKKKKQDGDMLPPEGPDYNDNDEEIEE